MKYSVKNGKRLFRGHKLLSSLLLMLGILPAAQSAAEDAAPAAGDVAAVTLPDWLPPAPTAPAAVGAAPTAQQQTDEPVTPPPGGPAAQPLATDLTVAEMGQPGGLTLSGVQLQSGITFTLPRDQVITNAKLTLVLKVSPALLARDASLDLMLNGQPLGSLPLSQDSGGNGTYELDIPGAMIVSSNNLSFRVSGSDSMTCQASESSQYWVTVQPNSVLKLEGLQLDSSPDLGHFPRPFFDSLQMQESKIPLVFSSTMKPGDVSAAAIVASYFGIVSDYRGVDFPVVLGDLPEQNGILFGRPGEKIGSLTLPASNGASLKVINNPVNPVYKLLLVLGNNDVQLRQAAYRLVTSPLPDQMDTVAVDNTLIPSRAPYDAPRWIDTSQPVPLGELIGRDQNNALTSNGIYHEGIKVAFRAAPDLFMWDGRHIPLRLDYHFPADHWIDEDRSRLNVSINGTFLRDLTVNKVGLLENIWRRLGGDSRQESYTLQLSPYLIYGDNQLQFYFDIKPKQGTPCSILTSNNSKSRIDPRSYIDLSGSYHFTQLPNLSYFVGASYPFSKLADFSSSLLLLPEAPNAGEIRSLMNMSARAGNATGVPVGNVQVAFGLPENAQENPLFARDILAVSTLANSGFNQRLLQQSPFDISADLLAVKKTTQLQRLVSWLTGDWYTQPLDADRYLQSNGEWRGFVSYRSPWSANHVVVLVSGSDEQELAKIHNDLKSPEINAGVRGDLAVITDENGVRSFSVGQQFPSGQMPWHMMVIWYASTHIVILAWIAVALSLIAGSAAYLMLVRHSARRLGKQPKK